MNVHSQWVGKMISGEPGHTVLEFVEQGKALTTQQTRILDAFEHCIQRAGFHRTTMQDVAREAGMSAGNLYRHFASKEALVAGVCERDRTRFLADFQTVAGSDDVMGAFLALGRQYLVEQPSSRCVQFLEIWAEASRNPSVSSVCKVINREVKHLLVAIVESAKTKGQVPPHVDSAGAINVLSAMGDGFFIRRALDPGFDAEEGFRLLSSVMDALFCGHIDLHRTEKIEGEAQIRTIDEASILEKGVS